MFLNLQLHPNAKSESTMSRGLLSTRKFTKKKSDCRIIFALVSVATVPAVAANSS